MLPFGVLIVDQIPKFVTAYKAQISRHFASAAFYERTQ